MKLLVADKYTLRRQSLVCLLRTRPEFEIIGEFSEGHELMSIPDGLSPDIILADINLPTINYLDPVTMIHQWNPSQKVLVLSDSASPLPAIRALRNGAMGYVVRLDDFEILLEALQSVNKGERFVSNFVTNQILDNIVAGKNFEKDIDERISSREREILQLIAEGKTNSEIGKQLEISTRTVETHRNNLMRKLGMSSQIEIIRYAFKHGLLTLED